MWNAASTRILSLLAMATLLGPPPEVAPTQGTATFTDLVGGGACSFPGEPPDNLHVGLPTGAYGAADLCGAYLDVTGPNGTVRVLVTDHCPNCAPGLVDVTRRAFEMVADPARGRAPVTYQLVRNPALAAPISLRTKDGSSPDWWALQVLDHGNALAAVELAGQDGWQGLERTVDNFWLATNPGPGDGPLTVRITDIYGQSVTVDGVVLAPGQVQVTSARLYPSTSQPVPSTSPSPSTEAASPTTGSRVGWPDPDVLSAEVTPVVGADPSGTRRDLAGRSRSPVGSEAVGPVFVILGASAVALFVAVRRR